MIRIVIELDGEQDPIEGEVVEPRSQAGRFRGWLALAALIETARGRQPQGDEVADG